MIRTDQTLEQYRRQLNRWVEAMADNDPEAIATDLATPYAVGDIDLFTEGNFAKRFEILNLQLSFLATAFADLTDLIEEYMFSRSLAAYAAGPEDGEAFLRWLCDTREITAEQQDHVALRQARFEVEDAARARRLQHVRFQERLSAASRLAKQLKRNAGLKIHLNPACGWATLYTRELLDDGLELPGNVACFAVGMEIHTVVLDEPIRGLLNLLVDGPLTLRQWASRAGMEKVDDLRAVARRLAEVGLLAFS